MKKIAALLVTICVITSLVGCSSKPAPPPAPAPTPGASTPAPAPAKKTWKLSNDSASDHPIALGLKLLSEEVNKRTNGSLIIDVYNEAQLGQELDTVEGVKLGTLEMAKANSANMSGFVPEMNVFVIPYIIRDFDHAWKVFDGEAGDIIRAKSEEKGFKIVTFFEEGPRYLFLKKGFIEKPEDMKGLKIRTMNSASMQDGFKAMGASPTPMNFGEVYTAIQQGVIDGAENNIGNVYSYKQYETAPFITDSAHLRTPQVILTNLKLFNTLTPDEQKNLLEGAAAAKEWEKAKILEMQKEYEDKIIAAGGKIQKLPEETMKEFIEIMKPVFDKYSKELGEDLINSIVNS